MVVALIVIWIVFDIAPDGKFLSPRNLWNLSVQTAAVAVMATGMVLIIVSRNIDLSVGSMVGVIGMVMALLQARLIPTTLGLGFEQPYTWIVTVVVGLGAGRRSSAACRASSSRTSASRPSSSPSAACWSGARSTIILVQGQTVSQLDPTFQLLGGGPKGSVGDTVSWIIGIAVCVAIVYALDLQPATSAGASASRCGRSGRRSLIGVIGCAVVLWAVWVANSYPWPKRARDRSTRRSTASWSRRAGSSSPPASPTRCSSRSASRCS